MTGSHITAPLPSPLAGQISGSAQPSYSQQYTPSRPSASPAPAPLLQHHNSYGSHGSGPHSATPQTPLYQQQQAYNQYPTSATTPVVQHPNPLATYNNYANANTAPRPVAQPSTSHNTQTNAYNPPRQYEIYTLADSANFAVPADIRAQFQQDDGGRIVFFTAPPLNVNPVPEDKQTLGHSLRYLADKARNKEEDKKKRKARAMELEVEAIARWKRRKAEDEGRRKLILKHRTNALTKWCQGMDKGTDELYQQMHGEDWKESRDSDLKLLAVEQEAAFKNRKQIENFQRGAMEEKDVKIVGFKWI